MKRIILAIIAIIAVTFAFVSLCAYDCESIGIEQMLLQVATACVVEWLALSHFDD